MKITHKIKMELDRCSVPEFDAVCGDRYTRELEIALFAHGSPWEPPAGTAVTVRYQKADGTAGVYDLLPDGTRAWEIRRNVVTVTAAPQALTAPGPVVLTVSLACGDRGISTFRILMRVRPAVGVTASESGDYWYLSGCLPQPVDAAVGEVLVVDKVDHNGRVTGLKTAGSAGISASQASALEALLALAVYAGDPSAARAAFRSAFGLDTGLIPATGIALSATGLSFTDTTARQLTAAVTPANATDVPVWSTSDPTVAVVSGGWVTPVGDGSCVITVTAGMVSASCAVTVALSEEVTSYSVSYRLTNASSSETVTAVDAGSSFTADINAAEGYTLRSVTVTMGGMDITAAAVTEGRVVIGSVSGNIIITAVGVRMYAVTNNLTYVTSSNAVSAVEEGSSYRVTLKPAMGYLMDRVTVIMGGTDITAQVYAAGKIAIGSVTGDLIITASAVADSRTLLHYWDFAETLTDAVGGVTAVLTGASQSDGGVRIGVNSDTIALGNLWSPDRTIEVDLGDEKPTLNYTKVLVMFGGSNGFSYGVNGGWGIYANGIWNYFDPQVKENGYFANSTLKLKVSAAGVISVYRNDTLLLTTALTYTGENQQLNIGTQGEGYNSVNPVLITGCRIYEGVE